jgi:hypothetical protein
VYHCHLLEHEDKGMMGSIRVDPAGTDAAHRSPTENRAKQEVLKPTAAAGNVPNTSE